MDSAFYNAKSIHIFSLGFTFHGAPEDIFDENLNPAFKMCKFGNVDWLKTRNEDEQKDWFARHQYFTCEVNHIFDYSKEAHCKIYELPIDDRAYYVITNKDRKYELSLKKIELHLYSMGCGILFFYCVNEEYGLDDIKKINDLGRRIALPFIPDNSIDDNAYMLCAEELTIGFNDQKYHINFRDYVKTTDLNIVEKTRHFNLLYDILFSTYATKEIKAKLTPFEDDRMHVISIIRDNDLSNDIMANSNIMPQGTDLTDMRVAFLNRLYELIFVDSGAATCQNNEMLRETLNSVLDKRWSKYGTLHATTDYSLMCLTSSSEDINSSVVKPMLVEYPYMYSLVFAQRMIMDKFFVFTGKVVSKKSHNVSAFLHWLCSWIVPRKTIIEENYIKFINTILCFDATNQTQGQELYNLMQKQHRIRERRELLASEIEPLGAFIQLDIAKKVAVMTLIATVIGLGKVECNIWHLLIGVIGVYLLAWAYLEWESSKNKF